MEKDLKEIIPEIQELLPYLSKEFYVDKMEIFGSFVRNEQHSRSDLDVLVTFSKIPSLIKFLTLKNYLSDHLGLNVDLVMKDSLKPNIKKNILSDSIAL